MSATVSVVAQKRGALSMYPMGTLRWKPTSVSVSPGCEGIMNASFGTSSNRIQTRMYASARSTFAMWTGPKAGSARTMRRRRR
eukprot:10366797-Ditylum_brightwellii.AAC.1